MEVLDNIPVDLTLDKVFAHLRLPRENEAVKRSVQRLLEAVHPIINAKALYDVAYIENKKENSLYINGVEFTSRVLRINFDRIERVFPYVVTCGREIDDYKNYN